MPKPPINPESPIRPIITQLTIDRFVDQVVGDVKQVVGVKANHYTEICYGKLPDNVLAGYCWGGG